jgi:UDP-N-acetylmuramoyl-tripeptide--D-alanyl-D-alanine ligase
MATFTVQEIVRATQGALVVGDLGVPVTGVSIDSRTLGVGEAFFAIVGHRLDGHQFIADAASRGAACVVAQTVPDHIPSGVPFVLVEDTTRALGRLAALHRAKFSLPLVAVTGSNGKTTTKEMTAAVLAARGKVLKPEGSFNNQWGVPLTLLRLTAEHQALVVEIGCNQGGEIAYLAGLAAPTVGVVTTVAEAHLELLGSLEGVREEKAALVRAIGEAGAVALNADDPRVAGMAADTRARVITYGHSATAEVRAVGEVREDARGLAFTLETAGRRERVCLAFAGRHNVTNALAAAAAGFALGLSPADVVTGLEHARPAKGRCVWREIAGVRILDDSYNANPHAMRAALDTAAVHQRSSRLVVVFGDMLELGALAEPAHLELGREVAARGAAEFVGFGPHMKLAVEAAREAGLAEAQHTATFEDTVAHALKRVARGDVVLIKGSRGMRMERVVDALAARLARPEAR